MHTKQQLLLPNQCMTHKATLYTSHAPTLHLRSVVHLNYLFLSQNGAILTLSYLDPLCLDMVSSAPEVEVRIVRIPFKSVIRTTFATAL